MGTIKGKVLSRSRQEEAQSRSTVSTASPCAGLPAPLSPGHAGPQHRTPVGCSPPCTPRLEHSEQAWPWKCHLKPRLRIVAAQPFPQFSHLREKGKEGAGAIINYAIFFTTASHRQLEHLMCDMAELQAINHSNIFTSECLNLQQHRFSETQCPEI